MNEPIKPISWSEMSAEPRVQTRSSKAVGNLMPNLAAACAEMKGVGKSGNNTFDHYTYATLTDYVKVVQPLLAKHNLLLIVDVVDLVECPPRLNKRGGNEYVVRVRLSGRLYHTSGEWIEMGCWGEGQDRGDKGVYKAITGARKYLLGCLFGLATTDDPEVPDPPEAPPSSITSTPQIRTTPSAPKEAMKVARRRGPKSMKDQAVLQLQNWRVKPELFEDALLDVMHHLDLKPGDDGLLVPAQWRQIRDFIDNDVQNNAGTYEKWLARTKDSDVPVIDIDDKETDTPDEGY